MRTHPTSERGQALILIVLGLVVLIGFTALAVDGGMVYSERRTAQNAADAAALSAALAKINGQDWHLAGTTRAASNGFTNAGNHQISLHNPPASGPFSGDAQYVQVIITSTLQTSLIHFVYQGPVVNTVQAVARAKPDEYVPVALGHALVGLKKHGKSVVWGHGTAQVDIYGGGVFVNSDDSTEALDLWGTSNYVIHNGAPVDVVGEAHIKPGNLVPMSSLNTHVSPIPYPKPLPVPTCDYNVSSLPSTMVDGSVYCLDADFNVNGNESVSGHDVLIWVKNHHSFTFNGGADINLDAMDSGVYKGILVYVDPSGYAGMDVDAGSDGNCTVKINGGSDMHFTGTFLTPSCDMDLLGNNLSDGYHSQFVAYTVETGGTDDLILRYNEEENYLENDPPRVELAQ